MPRPQARKRAAALPAADDAREQAAQRVARKRKLEHLLNTLLSPHGLYIYSRTLMHEETHIHGIISVNAAVEDAQRWPDAPDEPPHTFMRSDHPQVCERCGRQQEEHQW
jgi:hypothetical protein